MDLCRTCGQSDGTVSGVTISNYVVFNENKLKISDLLFTLTSLKFSEESNYPKNICSKCMEHLVRILWFINKCKQTNECLKRKIEGTDHGNIGNKKKIKLTKHESSGFIKNETRKLNISFVDSDEIITAKDDTKLKCNYANSKMVQNIGKKENKIRLSKTQKKVNKKISSLSGLKKCKTETVEKSTTSDEKVLNHDKTGNLVQNQDELEPEFFILIPEESEQPKEQNKTDEIHDFLLKNDKKQKNIKEETEDIDDKLDENELKEKPKQIKKRKRPYIKDTETEFKCKFCNKILATDSSLRIHLRRHNKVFKAYCDICKKGFVTPSELKKHQVFHSDDKNHACEFCEKRFHTKYCLELHIKSHHLKNEFSECAICNKTFPTKHHLKYHIRRVHAKNTKYVCNICSEELTLHDLKIHNMMHNVQAVLPELVS